MLQERAAAGRLEKDTPAALDVIFHSNDSSIPQRLRALWAMSVIGSLSYNHLVAEGLTTAHEPVRAWSARLLIEGYPNLRIVPGAGPQGPDAARKSMMPMLRDRIKVEESAYVRVVMASALQRADREVARELLEEWLPRLTEKSDPTEVQMLWYALVRHLEPTPDNAIRFVKVTKAALIRQNLVRFLMGRPELDKVLGSLFLEADKTDDEAVHRDILRGVREGLAGKKDVKAPAHFSTTFARLRDSANPDIRREVYAVAVLFGDKDAIAVLLKRVTDASAKADDRRAAVELLAPRKLPDFAKTLHTLLDEPALRGTAIRALAGTADAGTPAAIIKAYPKFTPEEKTDAVQTLAARVTFANALLDAVEKGTIPRSDVPVGTARQVLALNDKGVSERLEKVWGKITPVAKERTALMKKWKDILTEDTVKKADAVNGRVLFTKHCASCHKMFGEGQAVGPELTGSQRSSLDYVLENVLDPSAVVPREYQMVNFGLADERVVGGIVLRETKDAVTVRTVNDTLTIPTSDIVTRKQTPVSIMPEGLFDAMKPGEVRDLVAYLRAKEQVPTPKK